MTDQKASSSGQQQQQTPNSSRLKLNRSELEIVGNQVSQSQLPDIFSSVEQARLYRCMMLELANASDELLIKFLDHLLLS